MDYDQFNEDTFGDNAVEEYDWDLMNNNADQNAHVKEFTEFDPNNFGQAGPDTSGTPGFFSSEATTAEASGRAKKAHKKERKEKKKKKKDRKERDPDQNNNHLEDSRPPPADLFLKEFGSGQRSPPTVPLNNNPGLSETKIRKTNLPPDHGFVDPAIGFFDYAHFSTIWN